MNGVNNNNEFDAALGNIINIIVSYDMGWSKRGNGKNYDSLNGYGTIIGFLSGKILDYATRNRKCRRCDLGQDEKDHICRKNFVGSAKAMEADAGSALINNSSILKEANVKVRVLIGDDDSSTIAAIRKNNCDSIYKLSDKNHLTKNFSKELYSLATTFKELKRSGVINHVKKLFSYAISENKGNSEELAKVLCNIPDHLFQRHENCGTWCQRKTNDENQTVKLEGEELYKSLLEVFTKYAKNSKKFSVAASSQSNESVNNIIAHKAPKNICYSRTASADFRVASAICSKNDGECSVVNIKKKLLLCPGKHTQNYISTTEKHRRRRSSQAKTKKKKLRRIQLAKDRQNLRMSKEKSEGLTYKSNCGINDNYSLESLDFNSTYDHYCPVYFDLETSGLARSDEILQIGAKYNDASFSVYVTPTQRISESASKITGLTSRSGELYFYNKLVSSFALQDALVSFKEFLDRTHKPVLLVAHNANFDATKLVKGIVQWNLQNQFNIIGFTDSLKVLRRTFPERKGPGMFKLSNLALDILGLHDNEGFHDAEYDVNILPKIILIVEKENDLIKYKKDYNNYITEELGYDNVLLNLEKLNDFENVVSKTMLMRMAKANFNSENLMKIFKEQGEKGIVSAFTEKVDFKNPKVTKCKKVIEKVIDYLKNRL